MTNDSETPKKDLTGIFDLQKLQAENPEVMAEIPLDPFAVNELQSIEQVDHFDSIDQVGMMDHIEPTEDPFAVNFEQPAMEAFTEPPPALPEDTTPPVETTSLESIKNYSEQNQGKTNLEVKIHYPFHLKINGNFGPFERDKLLLFITENPIGLSSSDLDLQIQAGKVFLPRISEYAAIKLVQDLRDSGLEFNLEPSDRESHETKSTASPLSFRYENTQSSSGGKKSTLSEIPILNPNAMPNPQKPYQEIDEVSIVQFVRTDMIEVENSPIIQEVIERMTEALKQKARFKGGNALLNLKKEILPLRLPSQYQISIKASVIKI